MSECRDAGFNIISAEDIDSALMQIAEHSVDLVCLAQYMLDGNAFELCREMRRHANWRDCPIILLTDSISIQLIEKAFAAGFNETFHCQQRDALRAFLKRYGSYRRPLEGEVLVVEDSLTQQQLVTSLLQQAGLNVRCCVCVEDALQAFAEAEYDLVITDVVLEGELTGLDLITRIRRLEDSRGDLPIIVMSSYHSAAQRLEPFRIGADDYVSKPLEGEELTVRARRLIESHQLHREVLAQRAELERSNHFMTQMLGRVSHECRNSINIVLGVSKVLLRRSHLDEQQQHKMATIVRASKHQLSLLDDILDYTKLESGNIEFKPEMVDVQELAEEAIDLFRYACEERNVGLACIVDPEVPKRCQLDARLTKQVLINLLANAVKFTEVGEISLKVNIASGVSDQLSFSVCDSGPGIVEADLELLFSAFKQTREGRAKSSSTGLGLSLCAGFAKIMGGDMAVASQPGKGSDFRLTLPLG